MDYKILKKIKLGPRHIPTGKTKHFDSSVELGKPSILKIVQYKDDAGFYLIYCDDRGEELTDTYHDSLKDAMDQAKWEFQIEPQEWEAP